MFRSLFDPNSAFFRGMERVWTLVVLNVLQRLPLLWALMPVSQKRKLHLLPVTEQKNVPQTKLNTKA